MSVLRTMSLLAGLVYPEHPYTIVIDSSDDYPLPICQSDKGHILYIPL